MKLSDEQIKLVKWFSIYALSIIVIIPVRNLIKGNFDLVDTLLESGALILTAIVLGIFFIIESKSQTK